MENEKIVVVVRAVFKFEDKYLVVEQKNASVNTYLLFPGGHAKSNESLTEAIIREVKEELNVDDTKPIRPLFIKETLSPFDRDYEIFFECGTNKDFTEISVKQKAYTGYEKINKCLFKTEDELMISKNFFPEYFFATTKYQYLELGLEEYINRFGKDKNVSRIIK